MLYFKYPINALSSGLSHAEGTIFTHLLHRHFRFCRGDYSQEFFITDRALASISGCSTRAVYFAKLNLTRKGLISFRRGPRNTTYYLIKTRKESL